MGMMKMIFMVTKAREKCFKDFQILNKASLPGGFHYESGSAVIKYKYTNGNEISITWLTFFDPLIKMIEIAGIEDGNITDILDRCENTDQIINFIKESEH